MFKVTPLSYTRTATVRSVSTSVHSPIDWTYNERALVIQLHRPKCKYEAWNAEWHDKWFPLMMIYSAYDIGFWRAETHIVSTSYVHRVILRMAAWRQLLLFGIDLVQLGMPLLTISKLLRQYADGKVSPGVQFVWNEGKFSPLDANNSFTWHSTRSYKTVYYFNQAHTLLIS